MIHKKFPFLQHRKDEEKTRLITCHLNQIPSLKDNKILNNDYLRHLTIDRIDFYEGKVDIKLKIKLLDTFKDITSKFRNRKKTKT